MPRLLFEKTGNAVWISHLDLMRVFQRAFRRAGIHIWHSQGFSPRAHVSIALPLSVGTESVCEILEFELADGFSMEPEEILRRVNETLPAGVRVTAIWENGRKLKELTHLDADLTLEYDRGVPQGAGEEITAFFTGGQPIPVPKKSKSGKMTDLDIAPMVLKCAAEQTDPQTLVLHVRVCAQNPSLNPMLLGEALRLHAPHLAPDFCKARRLDVLDQEGNSFR